VMAEYNVQPKRSHALSVAEFQNFTTQAFLKDKNLVLLVDEAQQMTPQMMEVVRIFLNFESDNAKFLQVVLLGQNELASILDKMPAIKSRVAMFGALSSLTKDDMEAMIDFRWKAAGGAQHPFTPDALTALYELSRGLPREINKMCNESLIRAFVRDKREVAVDMVRDAARELRMAEPENAKPKKSIKVKA